MFKTYLKRFLEFIGFFLLVLIITIITSKIFVPKWNTAADNYQRMIVDSFYNEKKNSLDLVFVGNSDFYSSISPMELWNSYGIASYNYSHPGSRIWNDYYNIRVVLERQKPKYIFLCVDSIFTLDKQMNGNTSKIMTTMRLSKTKIEAMLNKDVQPLVYVVPSYIFPIIRFHCRYNDLNSDDLKYAFSDLYMPTKGFVASTGIKGMKKNKDYMSRKKKNITILPKQKKYLDKIVDLCNKNNIELILLEPPSSDSWTHERHNTIAEYAKNKKLKFIDLNYNVEDIGLDWSVDTKDKGNHLNLTGALKTTEYLGKYINDDLKLKDHRKDKKYSNWNKEYEEYVEYKNILLGMMGNEEYS